MKFLIGILAVATALAGCVSRSYRPAIEQTLPRVVENGCGRSGDTLIVVGQVAQAYENSIVLTDVSNPSDTLSINLPGRGRPGPVATMRHWLGTGKYELTVEKLNQMRESGTPVTVTIECKGARVTPVARNIEFTNPDGTRVAIRY